MPWQKFALSEYSLVDQRLCCWQASSAGTKVEKLTTDLVKNLKEGVLQEDFILDSIPRLMGVMRDANVTLRWMMLHCASLQIGECVFIFACCFTLLSVGSPSEYCHNIWYGLMQSQFYECCVIIHYKPLLKRVNIFWNFFSPSVRSIILFFPYQTLWKSSNGHPDNSDIECRWSMKNHKFSTNVLLYLGNDAR